MNLPAPPQADGYVTEIAYVPGYYRELNPSILTLVLNRQGIDPWKRGSPFTYLELGSGYGLSTLLHAAANPQAQFIAVDVLPDHIMTARALAEAAKLDNVTFIEGTFASLHEMAIPQCDFITMHGVWSWINAENRAHILKCVDACLKPGGVLALSYNSLPGCATILPMRELMVARFTTLQGPLPDRMASAISFADSLKSVRGGFFSDNPMALRRFEDLKERPRNYLAHEYFNANWTTFYHQDVATSLQPLGLTYISQANIFDTIDELHFSTDALALLNKMPDPMLRETLRDFMADRQFRTDVYVRDGAAKGDADAMVQATRFAALSLPEGIDRFNRRTTLGDINLPKVGATAILTALAEGPLTVPEMATHPTLQSIPVKNLVELVYMLAGVGAVDVAAEPADNQARKDAVRRLNHALREKNRAGAWVGVNLSSVTGAGIHVLNEDQLFFLARAEQDPIAAAARMLNESEAQIRVLYRDFLEQRLPAYLRMGID